MTKAVMCLLCADIVSPYRQWRTNRAWRWCEGGHNATRWRDGDAGHLEVAALHGPVYIRILGFNNSFLQAAVFDRPTEHLTPGHWRDLHDWSVEQVQPHYLFHALQRRCWALIVRPEETSDVTLVDTDQVPRPQRFIDPATGQTIEVDAP